MANDPSKPAAPPRRTSHVLALTLSAAAALTAIAAVAIWFEASHRVRRPPAPPPSAALTDRDRAASRPPASSPEHPAPRAASAPAPAAPDRDAARPGSAAAPGPPGKNVDALWASRWRHLDQADYVTARALARECLGGDPTDADCHHVLTQSFTRKGDYGPELDQAVDDCLAMHPDDAQCLETRILADFHARDACPASDAQCLDPGFRAAFRAAKLASAHSWLEKRDALTDQPPDFIGRAMLAEAEGDLTAACDAYRGACRFMQPFACKMLETKCADARLP